MSRNRSTLAICVAHPNAHISSSLSSQGRGKWRCMARGLTAVPVPVPVAAWGIISALEHQINKTRTLPTVATRTHWGTLDTGHWTLNSEGVLLLPIPTPTPSTEEFAASVAANCETLLIYANLANAAPLPSLPPRFVQRQWGKRVEPRSSTGSHRRTTATAIAIVIAKAATAAPTTLTEERRAPSQGSRPWTKGSSRSRSLRPCIILSHPSLASFACSSLLPPPTPSGRSGTGADLKAYLGPLQPICKCRAGSGCHRRAN